MATITIAEGATATVPSGDTLLYPGINSCLTLTVVFSTGKRVGGHSVLIPEGAQKTLGQICDVLNATKGSSIYILGDIATWDGNWNDIPQCAHLTINGHAVHNVAGIATALGYSVAETVRFDTTAGWGTDTYSIYFGYNGTNKKLWATNAQGQEKTVPGHAAW